MQTIQEYYKYCPDQVEVKISDAVCFGRRRANYPRCPGCQFNDDERGRAPWGASKESGRAGDGTHMLEKVFKAYDVRATYPNPLDETVAWRVGHAAALHLRQTLSAVDRADGRRLAMVVGRDMRKSSPALCAALVEGIRTTGVRVIDIGMIDTSQLYFAVNHFDAAGGIQTTASHNPAQYNGLKICGRHGAPIGENTGLQDIRRIAEKLTRHAAGNGPSGAVTQADLSREYKTFVRGFLQPLAPMRMVIDASNGMAGRWAPLVLGDVPDLKIDFLNTETNGEFVHEPNPLVAANLAQLREKVLEVGADLGVCFDGDADRCVLVDEKAQIVPCDLLTALLARWFLKQHAGSTVVFDLRSSRVVAEEIRKYGGVPRRERVGHAFMKQALKESNAVFGGELSGHFYFRDNAFCDSGLLALVSSMNVLSHERRPLSALIDPLKRYANSGERNFQTPDKDGVLATLAKVYRDGAVDDLDGITVQYDAWWFNVRKSNTEPLLRLNLEAQNAALLEEKLTDVGRYLGTPVAH